MPYFNQKSLSISLFKCKNDKIKMVKIRRDTNGNDQEKI